MVYFRVSVPSGPAIGGSVLSCRARSTRTGPALGTAPHLRALRAEWRVLVGRPRRRGRVGRAHRPAIRRLGTPRLAGTGRRGTRAHRWWGAGLAPCPHRPSPGPPRIALEASALGPSAVCKAPRAPLTRLTGPQPRRWPPRRRHSPGANPGRVARVCRRTPLLARPTGVGVFCAGILEGLGDRSDLDVGPTRSAGVAGRGSRRACLRGCDPPSGRCQPARSIRPGPIWTSHPSSGSSGPSTSYTAPNFVVPPTGARRVGRDRPRPDASALPRAVRRPDPGLSHLVRRALRRGAWVHTHSDFVAGEVIEASAWVPNGSRHRAGRARGRAWLVTRNGGSAVDSAPRGNGALRPRHRNGRAAQGPAGAGDGVRRPRGEPSGRGPGAGGTRGLGHESARAGGRCGPPRRADRAHRVGERCRAGRPPPRSCCLGLPVALRGLRTTPLQAMAAGAGRRFTGGRRPRSAGRCGGTGAGSRPRALPMLSDTCSTGDQRRVTESARGFDGRGRSLGTLREGLDQLYRAALEDQRTSRPRPAMREEFPQRRVRRSGHGCSSLSSSSNKTCPGDRHYHGDCSKGCAAIRGGREKDSATMATERP